MQDDLDRLGDVEVNDLGPHSARISEECVAEVGVSGDALREQRRRASLNDAKRCGFIVSQRLSCNPNDPTLLRRRVQGRHH